MPVSVFLDRANVSQHATPRRWVTREEAVEWGGETFTTSVQRQVAYEPDQKWLRREVGHLPEIAQLAREGRIELYDGIEARLESTPQFSAGISELLSNPFAGVPTELLPGPLDEGRIIAGAGRNGDEFLETDRYPVLSALKNNLGNRDAYHVFSAHHAGLDYFLTLERRLREAVREHVTVQLEVEVVWPSELLEAIGQTNQEIS